MSTPPKPDKFTPEAAPPSMSVDYVYFWEDRPHIEPRSIFAHTNGAPNESSIEGQKSWAERQPHRNTLPHYMIERGGDGAKFLPTNRRGIGNATEGWAEGDHGDISWFSLVIETTDTGTNDDPGISAFTDAQAESVAVAIAYESIVHGFPVELLDEWFGSGVASHTDPFGHPYTTLHEGKICPGDKKKKQVREIIIPRARQVVDAWTDIDEEEDIMGTQPELHYYNGDPAEKLFYWDGGSSGKYAVMGPSAEGLYKEKLRDSGYDDTPRRRSMGMARATGRVVNNPMLNPTSWVRYNRFGQRRSFLRSKDGD